MNPNKWMLVNFDCSTMWLVQKSQDIILQKIKTITINDQQLPQSRVRDRYLLTQALVVDPLYLQHSYSESAIDYRVGLTLPKKATVLPSLKQRVCKRTRQWYLDANLIWTVKYKTNTSCFHVQHWGIPLSRRFRSLKLWFVIRNYGVSNSDDDERFKFENVTSRIQKHLISSLGVRSPRVCEEPLQVNWTAMIS